jgi:hypothetical protein
MKDVQIVIVHNKHFLYIREFLISITRISVAPIFFKPSIISFTFFDNTKEETALLPPSSRDVTVAERFPGVIFKASERIELETLYMTSTYFVAVIYPSSRCLTSSTKSRCCAFGLTISIACVSSISVTISRPAA